MNYFLCFALVVIGAIGWENARQIISKKKKPGRPKIVRMLIGEPEFKALISGKLIIHNNVEVALQDIGYQRMLEIINQVWQWQKAQQSNDA